MNLKDLIGKPLQSAERNRCLAWGETGSGKTHFALTFPKPFVLDFEDQGPFLAKLNVPFLSFPMLDDKGKPMRTYRNVIDALTLFIKKDPSVKGIESIIIDSYTELSSILLRESVEMPDLLITQVSRGERTYAEQRVPTKGTLDRIKPDYDHWHQVRSQLDSITKYTWQTGCHIIGTARVRNDSDATGTVTMAEPEVLSGFRHEISGQFHDVFYLRDLGKRWTLTTRRSGLYDAKARFKKERGIVDTYEDPSYEGIYGGTR